MNLPVLHQLKTSSKDGASLKPKMENIFVIMLACKKWYVSTCGTKKVLQWNLDIMKGQGTGKYRTSFSITGVKKIICYTEDFVK